ncbi:MAG: hypothetical protein WBA17_04195, partial [Saprospiraceae bacterium]
IHPDYSVISCAASLNRKAIIRGQSFSHPIIQSFSHSLRAWRQSRLIGVQLLYSFFYAPHSPRLFSHSVIQFAHGGKAA